MVDTKKNRFAIFFGGADFYFGSRCTKSWAVAVRIAEGGSRGGREPPPRRRLFGKNKNNPTVAVRIAEGGSLGGSEEKYYSGKVLRRQISRFSIEQELFS